ncbi:MAG: sugar transferase [Oscillochloris sp.]|nr:sugar transferase [Oscillochloris sp.]
MHTTAHRTSDRERYYTVKRAIDIIVAGGLLLLLWPLMLLIAVAVKLDSPGPALFAQDRITVKPRRNQYGELVWEQRIFRFYKFRSMRHKADESLHRAYIQATIKNDQAELQQLQGGDTSVKKLTRDPRITRLGAFLRKTSLDELPQLINVIRGDISLVGPRPAIAYELELYKPWYAQRLEAIPGITGWWQVTRRSAASFEEMIELDIWYVERQSLWLDLWILFTTPIAVIFKRTSAG